MRLLSSTELWATLIGTLIGGRLALSLAHRERQQDRLEKLLVGYQHFFEKLDLMRAAQNDALLTVRDLLKQERSAASYGGLSARHAQAIVHGHAAWDAFEGAFRAMGLLEPERRRADLLLQLREAFNNIAGLLKEPPSPDFEKRFSVLNQHCADLRVRVWHEVEALRQRLPGVPGPSLLARLRAWATRLSCRWR